MTAVANPQFNRSKISNGSALLHGIDMRSRQGRRFRDLCREFANDLGEDLTAAEKAIVTQAAAATVKAEAMAAAVINGQSVDEEQYTRLSNIAGRLLRTLIGKRSKRRQGPGLQEYLAEHYGPPK